MTKNLLFNLIFMFLFSGALFSQSIQFSVKIVKTGEEAGVDISNDDGEFQNNEVDKLFDDDLDMGWEGEDLNVMTTFLRFQNITIPQGALIDSAFINLYAHEDEADEAKVTIFTEAVDNSPAFVETELLDSRTWSTANIYWDITEAWTMWSKYRSPNIKTVIQEVIGRSGWASGNALTVFLRGEDQGASLLDNARDFESFENIEDPDDGGDGLHHAERIPELVIYYHVESSVGKLSANQLISVYPSAKGEGQFTIEMPTSFNSNISVIDISGKVVYNSFGNSNSVNIDLSSLNNGIYIVKVIQNNNLYNVKIIK